MAAESKGGAFVDSRTIAQRMAWLKDLDKLPIGPTLPLFQPTRNEPIEPKVKEEEKKLDE